MVVLSSHTAAPDQPCMQHNAWHQRMGTAAQLTPPLSLPQHTIGMPGAACLMNAASLSFSS